MLGITLILVGMFIGLIAYLAFGKLIYDMSFKVGKQSTKFYINNKTFLICCWLPLALLSLAVMMMEKFISFDAEDGD